MHAKTSCGYVALIGRPNVGKSTLLNHLLGSKVSITSRKPQTTRHRILGIKTEGTAQAIFVDTPGIHFKPRHRINKIMIAEAISAIADVDVIIFLLDARKWTMEDQLVLDHVSRVKAPIVCALNKIDRLADQNQLLPTIQALEARLQQQGVTPCVIVPISAKTGKNLKTLLDIIYAQLPAGPHLFEDTQITDRSERFMAAELIREKILRLLGQEVPHAVAVSIEEFKESQGIIHIHAIILVERPGQKKIIIGEGGERLKAIGRLARLEMEALFANKVFLRLWVKIKRGWSDDKRALLSLGYGE